jgi:phosphoribosylformylglycinamidine cyclo-ligase
MSLTYAQAGVDVEAADRFVEDIAELTRATHTEVVRQTGGYAAVLAALKGPLALTCDGVGTKLLVARALGRYDGLGQDLVAMSVNDLLPAGARPVAFLDYIACGSLDVDAMRAVVASIAAACRQVGCALVGGETAEMPGVYGKGDFDLAGFALGEVVHPPAGGVAAGDTVWSLPSSGVHSNGLSLARRALAGQFSETPQGWEQSIGETLLLPTCLYVRPVLEALARGVIKAAAHVTGGGLTKRAHKLVAPLGVRLLPLQVPAIFARIGQAGGVSTAEMYATFNMGHGFLVVTAPGASLAGWQTIGEVTEVPGVVYG